MIPFAFMILLMMSVMTGGAYLMTAVVEEKGSRVMEVLLSAVSPMQLMVGKIVGQMCVAMLMLGVFGGLGVAGLVAAAAIDLVPLYKLAWLVVYFFLAFFVIASMMAAVGSAVNEMREAQTLQTPVMAIVMLPWLLVMPISRAPNSGLATALSFVPGLSPFVMVIRLGGSDPIPTWQYPATVVLGVATAVFAAWAAAKIFRIGVLMYGKPPDFRTLIRWVRMA
jgi:ABC-2 type transport system permease protein